MRIVIVLFDRFTALDAIGPYEVLRFLPGAEVVFAAARSGVTRTDFGVPEIVAQAALEDIEACDVLVVPGGPGMRAMLGDEALVGAIRRLHETSRWTASVCTGALLLAAAGLLKGRRATTHWHFVELLESLGANYTAERTVFLDADHIVTAAGVSSGIDMALSLAERLTDRTTAEAIQLIIEYDPRPPFDSGSPAKAPAAARERSESLTSPQPRVYG